MKSSIRNPMLRGTYTNNLETLYQKKVLTAEGKNWLINSLDPFHDVDVPAAGYPDIESAATVVQCVKYSTTISAPAGLTTTNWDAHFAMLPNLYPGTVGTAGGGANTGTTGAGGLGHNYSSPGIFVPANYLGGLVWGTNNVGGYTWDRQTSATTIATANNLAIGNLTPYSLVSGKYRIVGMGFEVHNTTADIYKQGSVTVYRQPVTPTTAVIGFSTGTQFYGDRMVNTVRQPPALLSDAMLLYGSKTWEAKDGVYVVSKMNNTSNPLVTPNDLAVAYICPDRGVGHEQTTSGNSIVLPDWSVASTTANTSYYGSASNDNVSPYDISGAYFTGLSAASTLTVDVRWYIERCPTADEAQLVVLATPSPCYDPHAILIYSHAMCGLPPGVPVGENPLGEWFAKVLRGVASVAPAIGTALNVALPGANTVAEIATKAANFAADILDKRNANKNRQALAKVAASELMAQKSKLKTVQK
jgi:hypothetical protein